jgi:methionyl-tRNA formyltransferase
MKKVCVMGKGDLCIFVCDYLNSSMSHELVSVVPVFPEPTWTGSIKNWCKDHYIPTVDSGDYKDMNPESVDLIISVFYDKIFSADYIANCKKIINIHNAPLPKYRGVSPINWALKNKEKKHGVTIHEILPGIDDGPIISQLDYSIYHEIEEVEDVYKKALKYAEILFADTIEKIDDIDPISQNDNDSCYYSNEDNESLGNRRNFRRDIS